MSRPYQLDIMTPKRCFFSGQVEVLTIRAPDGELAVLAGHAPLISALSEGSVAIHTNAVWREAFHSEGFMEVTREGVVLFVQVCEWAEDIDVGRAYDAKHRAEELLRQKQSINEHRISQISLARATARLQLGRRFLKEDSFF